MDADSAPILSACDTGSGSPESGGGLTWGQTSDGRAGMAAAGGAAGPAAAGSAGSGGERKIGAWMMVGLIYFSVSGGPLGMEVAVKAGGPFLALCGFIVMPLLWSVPEAAMTAELSIVFPEAAGFAAWTNAAFGPCLSFQCSMLSYFSGVLDNAVYPVLLLSYVKSNGDDGKGGIGGGVAAWLLSPDHPWGEALCSLTFTAALTYLTWRGLDVNGATCLVLTVFILLPFAVFCVIGAPQVDPRNWLLGPPRRNGYDDDDADDDDFDADDGLGGGGEGGEGGGEGDAYDEGSWRDVKWRPLVNILFWNLNYYDSASAFAGDCSDPARDFPRAMVWSLLLVSASYLLPLLVATGADPFAKYCDGCLVAIANDVASAAAAASSGDGDGAGGAWLGAWITASAAVSCVGMFIAEMASDSFQVMGMADHGQLPARLAQRSRHGTPTWGVLLSAVGVVAAAPLDFDALVELVNLLYIGAELIEFASFVKLRREHPDMPRAWAVPGITGWRSAAVFFLPPSTFLVAVLALSSARGVALAVAAAALTALLYVATCVARERRLVAFAPITEDWSVSRDPAWVRRFVLAATTAWDRSPFAAPSGPCGGGGGGSSDGGSSSSSSSSSTTTTTACGCCCCCCAPSARGARAHGRDDGGQRPSKPRGPTMTVAALDGLRSPQLPQSQPPHSQQPPPPPRWRGGLRPYGAQSNVRGDFDWVPETGAAADFQLEEVASAASTPATENGAAAGAAAGLGDSDDDNYIDDPESLGGDGRLLAGNPN